MNPNLDEKNLEFKLSNREANYRVNPHKAKAKNQGPLYKKRILKMIKLFPPKVHIKNEYNGCSKKRFFHKDKRLSNLYDLSAHHLLPVRLRLHRPSMSPMCLHYSYLRNNLIKSFLL